MISSYLKKITTLMENQERRTKSEQACSILD